MFDWRLPNRSAYYFVPSASLSMEDEDPYADLTSKPESGPGYQWCTVRNHVDSPQTLPSGNFLALNAELFIPLDSNDAKLLNEGGRIEVTSYEHLLDQLSITKVTSLGGVTTSPPLTPVSTLLVHSKTRAGEVYWRFSAYAADRRIRADESIAPNTFLTSDADYSFVATGLGAVGRYALPTPLPAIYGFSVRPEAGLDIQAGTVRPLFGQAGGGVEVVLVPGSGPYTVGHHRKVLPAW